jgi:nuclear RNA export factor
MVKSLHIGGEDTVKAIVNLPATKHDIAGPPEKFCVDSFPVDGRLLLTIHGEFIEGELQPCVTRVFRLTCFAGGTEGIRSFDRTFILASAEPGSRYVLHMQ